MSKSDERFYLATLTQSLGRAGAGRALAAHGSARSAYLRLPTPHVRAGELQVQCAAHGIRVLIDGDEDYPALLREVADPPLVLYARGDAGALLRPTVAVVGARRCTRSGAEVAASLAGSLARLGVCVVSGLAHGIDTSAHRAALAEGLTAAVIGSGLARPYPAANRGLADAIADGGGLLLSEHPPWQTARRHHFPERNRLISGVALGVVVVEAGDRSGSLITARMAAEQGRDVCAVPGPVSSPMSRGCHRLIQQGAALVERAEDVLETLGLSSPTPASDGDADDRAERPADAILAGILTAVEGTVTTLDEVVAATGIPGEDACAGLVELELSGFVRQVPGGYIRRPRR